MIQNQDEGKSVSYRPIVWRQWVRPGEKGGFEMKTKRMVLIALAVLFSAALVSNSPGTVIDLKDFIGNSFKAAMANDEPGTIIDLKDFVGNSFKAAMANDEPGTIIDLKDFVGNSFKAALLDNMNMNAIS
jgi:hypothetical protein